MFFHDLPEDVIHYALCLCDISSVISISQTNKYLHLLTFTPALWMALVEDLRQRGFVDRLSAADIRTMSTQNLVAAVRRLVVGPVAWSPGTSIQSQWSMSFSSILSTFSIPRRRPAAAPPPIEPSVEVVLHTSARHGNFKILQGGKYLLFWDVDAEDVPFLGCWRVVDDSLLGTYRSSLPALVIRDFEAEVLHGGEHANIVICMDSRAVSNPGFVEVISWDFATGVIELLSTTEYTGCEFRNPSPKICSGVATAHAYSWARDEKLYVIVDWHAQRGCEILPAGPNFRVELIPGHLIFTWTSDIIQEIRVVAMTSFSGSWIPVVQRNTAHPVLLSNLPHAASHGIKLQERGAIVRPGGVTLMVYENPLHCGTYRAWLSIAYSATGVLTGVTMRAMLCSFLLSLVGAGRRTLTMHRRSCAPATPNTAYARTWEISYSGHAKSPLAPEMHRIFPPDNSAPLILNIPEGSWSAHLLPYNGAVGFVAIQTFVARYFE
ncbi:hypothetical protein C8R44DRAFT_990332 [Mycena epipterygia]|nr:hypothetical protein C8R44DRAFT_990332 [Mycena epipterygia]